MEHETQGMRDAEHGTKGMEEKLPDPSDTRSDPPESPWSRPFVLEVFTRRPFLGVLHCTPCRYLELLHHSFCRLSWMEYTEEDVRS